MAARKKKTPTKKAASKGGKSSGSKPKFGSAAWFAKYPKAKRVAKKKKK